MVASKGPDDPLGLARDYVEGELTIDELARVYGVSRKGVYAFARSNGLIRGAGVLPELVQQHLIGVSAAGMTAAVIEEATAAGIEHARELVTGQVDQCVAEQEAAASNASALLEAVRVRLSSSVEALAELQTIEARGAERLRQLIEAGGSAGDESDESDDAPHPGLTREEMLLAGLLRRQVLNTSELRALANTTDTACMLLRRIRGLDSGAQGGRYEDTLRALIEEENAS